MHSLLASLVPAIRASRSQLFRGFSILALLCVLAGAAFGQADQNQSGRRSKNGDNANPPGGGRGNFDPAQMQDQMLTRLREALDVPDDAEWKLISEKALAVNEIRRAGGGGFGGMRGAPGGRGGGDPRGGRGGPSANPEQDSLRQAVTDKLPEGEIKSRLARLREARKANEEKLTKAQEDLRALLSVRQEAIAVMYGLLP